jgi:hypothetical protein
MNISCCFSSFYVKLPSPAANWEIFNLLMFKRIFFSFYFELIFTRRMLLPPLPSFVYYVSYVLYKREYKYVRFNLIYI